MKLVLVLICLVIMLPASFAGALEQSQGVSSLLQRPVGEGRWISFNTEESSKDINGSPGGTSGKYEFSVTGLTTSAGVPSILIYADDYVSPGPNTSVDKALQSAGLAYTAHYAGDFAGFENSLTHGEWDLVIFAHQNRTLPSDSTYNLLDSYVRKGGRLIFLSWEVGTYAANPLIADLGVQYVSDHVAANPVPVEWWFQQHRIFNAVPEFTNLKTNYVISGHFTNALPGTITLGGFTPNPTSGQGAVFSANDSRTLYLGFLDGNNEANLDGDIQKDAQEFWYNAISYVLGSPLVLLYSDNFVTPPPNTFPDVALRQLGFVYTAERTNPNATFLSLMAVKNWDLIVFAADSTTPQNETRAALNNYLLNGGKLIYHDWGAHEFGAGSPLYTTMGVSVLNSNFLLEPVHFWDTHPFFENVPELLSPQPAATFYGQKTNPTAGGYPIAGYSDAPSATNAAIIVSNKNRSVFKAFTDLQHGGADVDGDSQPDIVELWVNMIRLVGSHNILAIGDDYIHTPSLLEIAMIRTGKAYTITNLQSVFQNLILQRWWDVILCASESNATSTTSRDRLLSYVNAGGKLVYEDWSASAGHPLNAALGYIFVTDVTTPTPVFWWRDSHPLFSLPFPTPEYTNLVDNYGIDSINVQPINGNFQALGGATTAPATNSANVVLGNNFRTIFKGFLDGNNTADTDGDMVPDGEELWRNLIGFMTSPCLYCDDFDNSRVDSDWTVVKAPWSENNGEMLGSSAKKASIVATGFSGCEVCSFQATIKTAGGNGNKFWMLAWFKDKNNKIEILFNEEKDKILFKQRVNGVIVSKTKIAATLVPNTSYDVRIEHNGHDFGFYIDGELQQFIPEFPGTTWNGTMGFEVKNTTLHVGDVFILP